MIKDEVLCFDERKKLQNLISLLSEDSIDNNYEDERLNISLNVTNDFDRTFEQVTQKMKQNFLLGDEPSHSSSADRYLKKNNYEDYIDSMATKIQSQFRRFKQQKIYIQMRARESIKIFDTCFQQEGETLLFYLMKKISDGGLTAYCTNLSCRQMFDPISISVRFFSY